MSTLNEPPGSLKTFLIILLFLTAAIATALLASGCVNVPKAIKELKNDPAAVSFSVTTIYGNVKMTRIGARPNETVTVAPDGTIMIKQPERP